MLTARQMSLCARPTNLTKTRKSPRSEIQLGRLSVSKKTVRRMGGAIILVSKGPFPLPDLEPLKILNRGGRFALNEHRLELKNPRCTRVALSEKSFHGSAAHVAHR
jgi:hypothetical protein